MVELGVDEITLVLKESSQYINSFISADWGVISEDLISRFEKRADFVSVFGERMTEAKAPAGYEKAYRYGEHSFYLAVAYHSFQKSMGIIVKFSAQALDYYCQETGLKVYEFMQKIVDWSYTMRLSRIDLTADYINENTNITEIYEGIKNNRVGIFREYISKKTGLPVMRRTLSQYKGIFREQEVGTIYIGSNQSKSQMRIYDKKREQIERKGVKFDRAVRCENWIRFEGVFKQEYAHQLSEELLKIKSDDEYINLIASTILQKYRFMIIDKGVVKSETEYTQILIDSIHDDSFRLRASSSKNFELVKSILYIFSGSGVISTLYKIKNIWGMDEVVFFLEYIIEYLENRYKPNDDTIYWLKKNRIDYQKNHPDFKKFMGENISHMH